MNSRFKEVRKSLKLSLKQVGDALGLSESSVSNIERGRNNPSGSTLTLFCEKFHVNRHWLETGEGDMFQPKPESALPAELASDPVIRATMEAYLDLDPQTRQIFQKFFMDVVARFKGESRSDSLAEARTNPLPTSLQPQSDESDQSASS